MANNEKNNIDIKNYLESLPDLSDKLIALKLYEEYCNKNYNYSSIKDNNLALKVAYDNLSNEIINKKYLKNYKNDENIINHIEKLYLLCDSYYKDLNTQDKEKIKRLKMVITYLEALLNMNITFPECAETYFYEKESRKGK